MTHAELDAFLRSERTCRVGTVDSHHAPHVTPLWFVWEQRAVWIYSLTSSRRWRDLQRDARASIAIDAGHDYCELRGVELTGVLHVVGEVPRRGEPVPALVDPERAFADKYGEGTLRFDGAHGWLRMVPDRIVSWDHAHLASRTPRETTRSGPPDVVPRTAEDDVGNSRKT